VPPAPFGTLDLSAITDALLKQISDSYAAWPQWGDPTKGFVTYFGSNISGSTPESVRQEGGCQLNLYLLHVGENGFYKNVPPVPASMPPPQKPPGVVPYRPLALDLLYLLTAYARDDYREEQRAMSIAIRSLYEQPIVTTTVTVGGSPVPVELTVQMQGESTDELGRIWQAFNAPFRLSAVYRVSVVFISPEVDATPTAPQATRFVVAAEPGAPDGAGVTLLGTASTAGDAELSPAVAPLGSRFVLLGQNLDDATAAQIFLVPAVGPEQNVTTWIESPAGRAQAAIGLVVTDAAVPGVYRLQVGNGTFRSNATVVSIAARVDAAADPHQHLITGAGFVGTANEVLLGTVPLVSTAGPPGPGGFQVVSSSQIAFQPPADLPAGSYDVRVRVNGVEAPPTWQATVP
jgi:hypothetical protein